MFKCVYDPCDKAAEYIYFGKSLCKFHFKKEVKKVVKAAERAEKNVSQRSNRER